MAKRDFYEILGVDRGADAESMKKAYRQMARKLHPDVNPGDPQAEARFKELSEAYQILSDPNKRAVYDRYGRDGLQGGGAGGGFGGFDDFGLGGFGDIFDMFFGGGARTRGGRTGPARGSDRRYDLEITFDEAAFGKEFDLEVPTLVDCDDCGGTGSASRSKRVTCRTCNGTGEFRQTRQTLFGTMINSQPCPACGATGKTVHDPCRVCGGIGKKRARKTVRVTVPAGVDTGQRLRLMGEGEEGRMGGPHGDLYVFITVREHEFFKRDGQDVFCEVPISMVQATLGDEIRIPTLYGFETLKIPPGTQPGAIFRLREKGFPHLRGRHKGDQHVMVKVQVPQKMDDKQRKSLEDFARLMGQDFKSPQIKFFDKMKNMFRQ